MTDATPTSPPHMPNLSEMATSLSAARGFGELPESSREELVSALQPQALQKGQAALELGGEVSSAGIVHAGAIEVRSATGKIFARLLPGESFGLFAALKGSRASYQAVATEDSIVLRLPAAVLQAVVQKHPELERAFEPMGFERTPSSTPSGVTNRDAAVDLMTTTARDLMTAGPITTAPATPLIEAAGLMRRHNVSCLPVVENDKVIGIITDTDLRNRVVAEAADTARPVSDFMSTEITTLPCEALAFDALVMMMQRDIAHLPITSNGKLAGILTQTNLVRAQSRSAVYMIGEIHRFEQVSDMAGVVRQIPDLLVSLVESGASAHKIGRIITSDLRCTHTPSHRTGRSPLRPAAGPLCLGGMRFPGPPGADRDIRSGQLPDHR